jgi:hypothetical protein
VSAAALEAIEQVLAGSVDADEALRGVVDALVANGCDWAGILFVEHGGLVLGPSAGAEQPDARVQTPVVYRGDHVAELVTDGCGDDAFLGQVAERIAAHCLVGWDTGGVPWDPSA